MEKKIYFQNSKGDKLCGVIINPSGSKERPIIVMAHGFSTSKNSASLTAISEKLNNNSISTLRFDFYGHGESEGSFEDITVSEAVDDILQAIRYLKSKGYKKIGLMGSSFGGIASIMAASETNDLYVVALKSPVSDYETKEVIVKSEEELEEWREKGYRYYVSGDGRKLKLNYSFFEDAVKNNGYEAAPRIQAPTLIVHGDNDESVPYEQSVKLSKIIPNCLLHTVRGAGHQYDKPEHWDEMLQTITNFVVEYSK